MRVISGEFGSRPLKAVPGKGTRPTTDKIKESMFNLIGQNRLSGICLDFYGGSGALGIEAVSRGCQRAVITERNGQAIQTIRTNVAMTQAEERFTVLKGSNRTSLKQLAEREPTLVFDWVFLDPPYKDQQVAEDIAWLEAASLLSSDCAIICEVDATTHLPDKVGAFEKYKERRYGQTHVCLYQRGVHA